MSNQNIHPRYANINDNILTSEVMASKYANEVTKAGYGGNKEDVIDHMEQLDNILRESGAIISNEILEMFAEVTVFLGEHDKSDLIGKVPIAISKLYHQAIKEQHASVSYIDKLKSLSEEMADSVNDLKRTSATMKAILPRMKIKAKRHRAETPVVLHDAGHSVTMDVDQAGKEEHYGNKGVDATSDKIAEEVKQEGNNTIPLSPHVDPKSAEAKRMRDSYRSYYSYDKFSAMTHEQQVALLEYYLTHIIRVATADWEDDAALYSMFTDIVDKERMMAYCKMAQEDELTPAIIEDAIYEMHDIIEACSPAYGRYTSEILEKEGVLTLHIISA